MKKFTLFILMTMLAVVSAIAQSSVNTNSSASATSSASAGSAIATGTQITGQLQSSLDANKAQIGDRVVLKTTKAVKQNGKTVVEKGSLLIGRVTEVTKKTKGNAMSSIGLVFDRLQQGKNELPISTMITSVFSTQASTPVADMNSDGFMTASSQPSSRQQSGTSGGGLLGGVGSTVGGVVNSTTQTVGGVVNTAGATVGSTTGAVTSGIKGLSVSNSTSASAQGSSTLSQSGKNVKVDKGTNFNLSVSSSTTVSNR